MEPLTIAAVSCLILAGSPEHNLGQIEKWSRLAADQGADLVVFNETSLTGYWMNPELRKLAEPLDGPSMKRVEALAKELDLVVSVGIVEKAGDFEHNTHVLVGPEGLIGYHRKSSFPGGEEKFFDLGDDRNVHTVGDWKVGMAICFESVHPDTCRDLAQNGAQVILAPYHNAVSAREIAEGKRKYFFERALTNKVWYVAVEQAYRNHENPTGPVIPGAIAFVNPRGEMVKTTPLDQQGEHMIVCTIEDLH